MTRYLLIMATVIVFFLTIFLIVEALGVPLLADPTPWMQRGGIVAAALGVSLLIVDVLLPVPSSLVMVAHGALFGVVSGTFLSLAGSMGAALLGFAIGRRGDKLLARIVTLEQRARADRMLTRWGALAVVLTRPIPLLAETVAIMAGASSLGWGRMILAALAGSLPPALLYALTGAAVANLQSTSLMFGVVLLVTGSFWLVGRLLEPYLSARKGQGKDEQAASNSDAELVIE
jgi:uncharacterized membrane protein YdjX (TVP38/TMEM64 family)